MIALYLSLIDEENEKTRFEKIYYGFKNLMYYIAFQVLQDERDSEDAVQEAFLRIARNMDKIDDILSKETKNFVAIITKREAMKIYNKKKKRDEDFSVDLSSLKKENSDKLVNEVQNAIEQLPYKFSSLLTLKYVLGYSGKEIAEITGLSETNVRQQLLNGRKMLSQILEEDNQ
ncbi:RNA polymerase sigma factor [uncultured Eubacterium sp.]|uniref:RNA polymerase sigma factor n=1 Tax=uncultured Eubacterium sp. TaxID=165185 RepID=UPI002674153B|nr:sigma-70 family RNA polymerase sigma factor [uncultured Eubacterium sp.]